MVEGHTQDRDWQKQNASLSSLPNEEYGYSKHASNFKAVRLGKDLGDLEMGGILR